VQVVGFDAALGRHRTVDEAAEHLPRDAYHPLVFADADAELDRLSVRVHLAFRGS
jgi:hypothetical protein